MVVLSPNIWRLDMIVFGNVTRVQLDFIGQYLLRLTNRHNPYVHNRLVSLKALNGPVITLKADSTVLSLKLIFNGSERTLEPIRNGIMENFCNDVRIDRPVLLEHCNTLAASVGGGGEVGSMSTQATFECFYMELPSIALHRKRTPLKRNFGSTRGDYVVIDDEPQPGPSSAPPQDLPLEQFKRGRMTNEHINIITVPTPESSDDEDNMLARSDLG